MCVLSIYIFQGCHFRAKATQRLVVVVVIVVFAAASASSHRLINAYYLCYCVLGKKASNFLLFFLFYYYCVDVDLVCLASKEEPEAAVAQRANTTRRDGDVNDRRRHKSANKACANCGLVFVLFYFSLFLFFFFLVFLCVFFR